MKLSISELSNLTGMDRRRIGRALTDLRPEKGPKGALLYESTEALPSLYLSPDDGDTYDLTQERARLAHHQANKAALEAQELRGALIAIEQVAEVVGDEYANVRAKLLALPTKAAPVLVGLSTMAIKRALDDLVSEALEELSANETYAGS
jgi:hypothetical protein